jgi:hypothetical protein
MRSLYERYQHWRAWKSLKKRWPELRDAGPLALMLLELRTKLMLADQGHDHVLDYQEWLLEQRKTVKSEVERSTLMAKINRPDEFMKSANEMRLGLYAALGQPSLGEQQRNMRMALMFAARPFDVGEERA